MLKEFDSWGNSMMWIVWIGAVLGIIYQYTFHEQYVLSNTIVNVHYIKICIVRSVTIMALGTILLEV